MEILLVEDDPSHAKVIRHTLERHGHLVTVAATGSAGKHELERRPFDLMLVDYVLPDSTGLALLDHRNELNARTPTIFLTAVDSAEVCLTAIRRGASDYIVKGTQYLRTLPQRIAAATGAAAEPLGVPSGTSGGLTSTTGMSALDRLLGASDPMIRLRRVTAQAARSHFPVLIEGPTGAGKELVARAIHDLSPRVGGPFVAVDCASLPTALFESELFGHAKGAFTNAVGERRGLVLGAHEGTLFLDEVGELAPESQAKLLRLLQTLEVRPVGCDKQRRVDVRVVAATNRNLRSAVAHHRFRDDLYYRLAVIHLQVPSLAERPGDVPLLAREMVQSFAPKLGMVAPEVTPEAYAQLDAYTWPGNVRELENVVKRTMAHLEAPVITRFEIADENTPGLSVERAEIEALLREFDGNLTQAARALRVSRPTLYKRLRELGIGPDYFRRQ